MNVSCPHCHTQLSMPTGFEGGKVSCPVCSKAFMCDTNGVSYVVASLQPGHQSAPKKHGGMIVRKKKPTYADMKRRTIANGYGSSGEGEEGDNGALCFWLGFLFWLVGLIVAAIIGKGRGVKSALWGLIFSTVIYIILMFLLGVSIARMH